MGVNRRWMRWMSLTWLWHHSLWYELVCCGGHRQYDSLAQLVTSRLPAAHCTLDLIFFAQSAWRSQRLHTHPAARQFFCRNTVGGLICAYKITFCLKFYWHFFFSLIFFSGWSCYKPLADSAAWDCGLNRLHMHDWLSSTVAIIPGWTLFSQTWGLVYFDQVRVTCSSVIQVPALIVSRIEPGKRLLTAYVLYSFNLSAPGVLSILFSVWIFPQWCQYKSE